MCVYVHICLLCGVCVCMTSVQRFKDAERWCSLGMRFLKFLKQLKPSYEDQVTTHFSLPNSIAILTSVKD